MENNNKKSILNLFDGLVEALDNFVEESKKSASESNIDKDAEEPSEDIEISEDLNAKNLKYMLENLMVELLSDLNIWHFLNEDPSSRLENEINLNISRIDRLFYGVPFLKVHGFNEFDSLYKESILQTRIDVGSPRLNFKTENPYCFKCIFIKKDWKALHPKD